jgi:hypothetical protein
MLPQLHGQSELSKVVVWLNRKVAKVATAKRKKIKKIWSNNYVNYKYSYVPILIRWVFHHPQTAFGRCNYDSFKGICYGSSMRLVELWV